MTSKKESDLIISKVSAVEESYLNSIYRRRDYTEDLVFISVYVLVYSWSIYRNYVIGKKFCLLILDIICFVISSILYSQICRLKSNSKLIIYGKLLLVLIMVINVNFEVMIQANNYQADPSPFCLIKSVYKMVIINSFSYVFLVNFNIILIIVGYIINVIFILITQFFYVGTKFNLTLYDEIYYLTIIMLSFSFFKKKFENTTKTLIDEEIKHILDNDYYQSLLDRFPGFFISISNETIKEMNTNFKIFLNSLENKSISYSKIKIEIENDIAGNNKLSKKFNNFVENLKYINKIPKNGESIIRSETSLKSVINSYKENQPKLKSKEFISIGVFQHKSSYFDVFFRTIKIFDDEIEDIIFEDITHKIIFECEKSNSSSTIAKFAHEFKTPLLSIISLIEELDNVLKANNLNEVASDIISLSKYTMFLISDITEFSKSSLSCNLSLNYNFSEVNLLKFIEISERIAKSLLKCMNRSNLKIFTDFPEDLKKIKIKTNENRVLQIILNLLSNSIKFTKCGFIKLSVVVLQDKKSVKFSIQDTGNGIKEEELKNLFETNHRFTSLDVGVYSSSGLGLSISQKIASQLNSQILVDSTPGNGSTFSFTIPDCIVDKKEVINNVESPSVDIQKKLLYFSQKKCNFNPRLHTSLPFDKDLKYQIVENEDSSSVESIVTVKKSFIPVLYEETNEIEKESKFKNRVRKHQSFKVIRFKQKIFETESEIYNDSSFDSLSNNDETSLDRVNNKLKNTSGSELVSNEQYKIIVADDCLNIVNSISSILTEISNRKRINISVLKARDGVEILNLLYLNQFDISKIKLVISDENMEILNGSEALKIIRKIEQMRRLERIKFCILSSEVNRTQYFNSIGVDKIIDKHYNRLAFEELLREFKLI